LKPNYPPAELKLAELAAMRGSKQLRGEAARRLQKILASDPDNSEALTLLAYTEMLSGKEKDAGEHLSRALEKAPATLKASVMLATVKMRSGDFKGAEEVLKNAVQKSPGSIDALIASGRLYLLLKNPQAAAEQFRLALKLDPHHGPALLDAAALALRSGSKEEAGKLYRRLADLRDRRYRPLYAMFLMEQGNLNGAIAELERLAAADRDDRQIRSRLVSTYLASGRVADAEKLLAQALDRNPEDSDALLQRAAIHASAKKWPEAEKDLALAHHYHPDNVQIPLVQAEIHRAQGKPLLERKDLNEALRLDPGLLGTRIRLSQLLIESKSAKSAVEVMKAAPLPQQKTLAFVVQRNWALLGAGQTEEARAAIAAGLAEARSPDLLLQDALLKLDRRDYAAAQTSLEEALTKAPHDLRIVKSLADTLEARNRPAEALARVREYAARYPESAPAQYFLGQFLLRHGAPADAERAFQAAKTANPTYVDADLALARQEIASGRIDAARQRLSALAAENADNAPARLLLGALEEQAGNRERAIDHYRRVLNSTADHVPALNNLASLLTEVGRADDGMAYAQRAVALAPEEAAPQDTLGWIYYRKGLHRTAVRHLEIAVSKEPSPVRKFHLAMAYIANGDARGHKLVGEAIASDPRIGAMRDREMVPSPSRR
jgi:tetratricopeptide (TPR) repeat protein